MKLATIIHKGEEAACVLHNDQLFLINEINRCFNQHWPCDMLALIQTGGLAALNKWYAGPGREQLDSIKRKAIPFGEGDCAPLYRRPRKIWGIGLNYREHAADLSEKSPIAEPASFMKPDTAIIGHGDIIEIPRLSEKTTGEAELGIIFREQCRHVDRADWLTVVAGFTTILDMTAEDILRRNPRNLTQSKSFDTFFSFGPVLVTPDEIADVMQLKVSTVINGKVHAENVVSNMTFPPDFLVSYHSRIMTMLPGDILSTGTPGAAPLADGDTLECRIDNFPPLVNRVKDLKT
jgi:2-keto-4-pentenoate hydratase/2-oxohepta-3-ene-1,7-dioic acid hydratase in catechol pathway